MKTIDGTSTGPREFAPRTIVFAAVMAVAFLASVLSLLWKLGASPFQSFSIPIVSATGIIAAWMAIHWREWRALPISLVAGMALARLGLGLCTRNGLWKASPPMELLSDMILWATVPLGFAAVAFLVRILENQARFVQAQKAQEESEKKYRHLVESATDAYYVADAEGRFTLLNAAAARIFGRRVSDLIGRSLFDLISPETVADIRVALARQVKEGTSAFCHQFSVPGRDGTAKWVSQSLQAVAEKGVLNGFQAGLRDITESRDAQENARIVEFALDHADEHVFMLDRQGTIVYANRRALSALGYGREEILSKTIHDIDPQVSAEDWAETWRAAMAGEQPQSESIQVTKDGRSFPTIMSSSYFEFQNRGYIFAFVHDVSREADLTSQLRQSQKIEAIGMLAGGIAHDFNNILSAIIGYTELAIGESPADGHLPSFLAEVKKAANRAADLVRQILTFSRSKEQERHPMSLEPVIKEAMKLLRGSLPATIELRQTIQADAGPVMSDPVQIHQVIMNLCTNAYHAMRDRGGVLSVDLREMEIGPGEAIKFLNIAPGTFLRLSVTDTGCGMDERTRRRIFDPFFTTKPEGEGTGLGLATVLGIVKGHKGAIHVDSKPGEGTCVEVLFPVCVHPKTRAPTPSEEPPAKGRERILFVDDERPIADSVGMALEKLGYRARICLHPREALDCLLAGPDGFDMLVTDYTMPGMTGLDLARQAHARAPQLPIVLCTGFGQTIEDLSDSGIRKVLRKPLTIGVLTRELRGVLDTSN